MTSTDDELLLSRERVTAIDLENQRLRGLEAPFHNLIDAVTDYAIYMLDVSGNVATWNAGAQRTKGYLASEIIGRHFSVFYTAEDRAAGKPERILATVRREGRFEDEGWRVRKDGTRFWANVVITAVRDAEGELVGFAKVTRDLTARREREEALHASEERFHRLVDAVTDYAIFMLDTAGNVATWNAGAQKTKGYLASEIIGKHFSVFYTPEDRAAGKPGRLLEAVRREGRCEDESWRVRKDGSLFWANVIITALRDTRGEISGFAKVTRDLTARRKAEQDQAARRELEGVSRAKDEFLAVLGHELRNPLAPMLTAVHLIKLRRGVNCEREIAVLDRQVVQMMRLLDDLLDVSRIIGNRLDLDKRRTDIGAVIANAVDVSASNIEQKRHRLRVDVPADALLVDVDLDRITQLFSNVLNNAAKYTSEGGEIRVRAEASGHEVVVTIEDTGIGIPPDVLPRIFGLFTQGEHARQRQLGGFGVGLAVAKRVATAHGGDIRAESAGVGHGSRFIVTLPRSADVPVSDPGRSREPVNEPPAASRRVLVVDDNHDAAEMIAEFLKQLGHDVRLAFDGPSALDMAREVPPQIVLMDLGLPGIDGFETARRMREMPGCAAIPIIAISGYAREADRRDAIRAGFTEHFPKPIDIAQLGRLVERAQ